MRVVFQTTYAQLNLLTGIYNRNTISLDSKWRYIVDPLKPAFMIITIKKWLKVIHQPIGIKIS